MSSHEASRQLSVGQRAASDPDRSPTSDLAEPGVAGVQRPRNGTVGQRNAQAGAERTLSTQEAAAALGKSAQTVRDYVAQGKLRARTDPLNGRLRIPVSELTRVGVSVATPADDDVGRLAASLATSVTERLEDAVTHAVRSVDAQVLAEAVADAVREDLRASQSVELARARRALRRLAAARFWQRRAVCRALRRDGFL
jgi:hypothetical protein